LGKFGRIGETNLRMRIEMGTVMAKADEGSDRNEEVFEN
jgi:hypothetical protein